MKDEHPTSNEKETACKALLRSTGREGIEPLIEHLEQLGYFIAPGSKTHHCFKKGLLTHSMETYRKAMELREKKIHQGVDAQSMPEDSVILAALLHDVCKADVLRYSDTNHTVYTAHRGRGHSARSVRKVQESGFNLTTAERDAILWHMGGKHFNEDRHQHFARHPLSEIIYWADKDSIRDAAARHYRDS